MNKRLEIILPIVILLVLTSYLFFNWINSDQNKEIRESLGIEGRVGITNFAILNDSIEGRIFSREEALESIRKAEKLVGEMESEGFSVDYLKDVIIEANRTLEQVDYAEILRGNVEYSQKDYVDANKALRLIDWDELSYEEVIILTEEIISRNERAKLLEDLIILREKDVREISDQELSELLSEVKTAFEDERYDDTDELLVRLRDSIEDKKIDEGIASSIGRGIVSFIRRYWVFILLFMGIVGYSVYRYNKRSQKDKLRKKIKGKMKERKILVDLMKRTQVERFKENKISGLVYNIRLKKYKDKLERIRQEIPVLEERLRKIYGNRKPKTLNNRKEMKNRS